MRATILLWFLLGWFVAAAFLAYWGVQPLLLQTSAMLAFGAAVIVASFNR
jgi:hypothetical protein